MEHKVIGVQTLQQRLDRTVVWFVIAMTAARILYLIWTPTVNLTYRSTDDSYYYFQVARNIVRGNGVSFDGINPTNGFHPLWLLTLLPIYMVWGGDPETALRAAFCLVTLFAALTALLTYWFISRTLCVWIGLTATAILLLPPFLNTLLCGMETGLLVLIIVAIIVCCLRYNLLSVSAGPALDVLLGILLASMFLARLDTVFLVFSLFVSIAVSGLREFSCSRDAIRRSLRKSLVVGGTFTVFAMPYLLWNWTTFHAMVPISGAIKGSFPNADLSFDKLSRVDSLFGGGQVALSLMTVALSYLHPAMDNRIYRVFVTLASGCILHFLFSFLFMNWAVYWWHYAAYMPTTVWACCILLQRLTCVFPALPWAPASLCLALILSLGGTWWEVAYRGDHHKPWYQAALWVRDNLPPNSHIAMSDCGLFGYFCDRPTINLDGVINGYKFQRALNDGGLSKYLQECLVTHVADDRVYYKNNEFKIHVPGRLHKTPGCTMIARPDGEVYRSACYTHFGSGGRDIRFIIWRFDDMLIVPNTVSP